MTSINQTSPPSAADIRAAALAFEGQSHPITQAEQSSFALTDDFARSLSEGSSATVTSTLQGTTVNGEPIASWVSKLAADSKLAPSQSVPPASKPSVDTVVLSPQATAYLAREKVALALVTEAAHSQPVPAASDTATAAPQARPSEVRPAAKGGVGTAPESAAADAAFVSQYTAEAAEGPAGRFYQSADPQLWAQSMSDDEYAAFQAAFENHTLTITSAADAPGASFEGSLSATFTASATGGSEYSGGSGPGLDISHLQTTDQYSLGYNDLFLGASVITWGGPATPASTVPSAA